MTQEEPLECLPQGLDILALPQIASVNTVVFSEAVGMIRVA